MPRSAGEMLVVLPTYNERASLSAVVLGVQRYLPSAHILIIDDGSPDGTGIAADEIAARDARVEVHHRPGKLGLGTAYVHGFGAAIAGDYRFVVAMDADGSHLSEDLPALVAAARTGAGLVIGTRWIAGGRIINWPMYRRWISRGGTWFARAILRSRLHDLTSGFRVLEVDWLRRIDLDALDSQGYGFQVETAWRLERLGCPIAEVPITFVERVDGRSKMSLGIVLEAFANVMRWGLKSRRTHDSAG
ncbi:polyprenol monophosphomannose synthase [Leucobacter sp. NPDC077196]|uniref:polyprenol monophosphomannose synthase n=1 Tax=Leucobacter sp. NPDC077196 TaxID=3154959 RepID=UPI003430A293